MVRRVCAGKLGGAQKFTIQDATESILSDLADTTPSRAAAGYGGQSGGHLGAPQTPDY
jgi:hypothetical protein